MIKTDLRTTLLRAAQQSQKNSYSPFSGYKIGSAVLWTDGTITTGCNVENASYGATVCAERVAIWNGISNRSSISDTSQGTQSSNSSQSSQTPLKIEQIMVISSSDEAWPPCGMCRQVIAEFGSEETLVHIANVKGESKTFTFREIFPFGFNPTFLTKS